MDILESRTHDDSTSSSFPISSVTLGTVRSFLLMRSERGGTTGRRDVCIRSIGRSERTEAQNEGMRGKRQEWKEGTVTVYLNDH